VGVRRSVGAKAQELQRDQHVLGLKNHPVIKYSQFANNELDVSKRFNSIKLPLRSW
jgi:hypothetical protein